LSLPPQPAGSWHAAGRVAVIGGGIAGLACALRLARGGAQVTLLEAGGELGGLGSAFDWQGVPVERFYHCMLPSDAHLLGLLGEVGLAQEVYWRQTSFAMLHGQRLYPLNGAADLLRFQVLPLADRLRLGLTGLWGRRVGAQGLDDISCEEWLTRLSGRRAYAAFWRPLLQAKFGEHHREVPALWFWTRFNREKGAGPETKGYLPGGYRRIAQTLAAATRAAGGQVRLHAPVRRLDLDDQGRVRVETAGADAQAYDRVVYAAPYPGLQALVAPALRERLATPPDAALDLMGVVNTLWVLRRSLSPHYWVATPDAGLPFQGLVETTTLLDRAPLDGHHLVYLTRYLHRSDAAYARSDAEVLAADQAALQRVTAGFMPGFTPADVRARYVFRSPAVEPIYTLGYGRRRPPAALLPGRLYAATTSQVYPQVTSWNGSVGLVDTVLQRLREDLAAVPAGASRAGPPVLALAAGAGPPQGVAGPRSPA
jgi:protoporphyrinogen oxidase